MKLVIRENDPKIIDRLKNNFIEDGCYSKEVMSHEFRRLMELCPDDICVLVGYDDDIVAGFLIAHTCDNRDYAYLAQAVSVADNNFAKEGFGRMIEWCRSKGVTEIRYETERNSSRMMGAKRYGFIEHGVVMSRKL